MQVRFRREGEEKKNEKPDFPIRFVEFVMNLKWSGWVNNVRVDYMDG